MTSKPGRFELAHEGTLFLDEVGEMPPEMQVKLLRVLQEQEFERVGGVTTTKVDVRIITATNKNLEEEVKAGRFREDLFYRLNVVPISSCRRCAWTGSDDIDPLVKFFLRQFNEKLRPRQVIHGPSRPRRCSRCAPTPGRATSASLRTCSSAWP